MKQKIIFLDVDGVLNSYDFYQKMLEEENFDIFNENFLDPKALRFLKKIVEESDAEIVLSSSWKWSNEGRKIVDNFLKEQNLSYIDTTPLDYSIPMNKKEEITAWLSNHPNVKKYVILDDDEVDIKSGHQVKTTFAYGLTLEKAIEAIEILGRKE